ncbi:MAG TPA: ATP-binding cassette domain-containing protein [Nocardioides sp.]|nr:ATP-binding cassette domain-containing protein [Nocardioides sp.]
MNELRASGLSVSYGDLLALHPLDLEIGPGRMVSVTGPSGAGKSTLLWALAGALVPTAGRVHLGEAPVDDRELAAALGVVVVPQGNGLASSLTAAENVVVPLLAKGVDAADAHRRTAEALTTVGLEESGNHLIEELSGGQQQRVALARALAARAAVLLADEPTSDLDAANRERAMAALRAEAVRGAVVVVATHDAEAAAQTDAELHLDEGVATWRRPLA